MKLLVVIFSFVLVQTSFAQNIEFNNTNPSSQATQKKTYVEVGIIPTYFVNKLQVGIARVGKRNNEFTFSLLGRYVADNEFEELHSSYGMHFSWNKSIKTYSNNILYFPIWSRTSMGRTYGLEDMVFNYYVNQSFGSGLGYKHSFKNQHQFRMEGNLGIGAGNGAIEVFYPNTFRLFPISRVSFRYMIPISK